MFSERLDKLFDILQCTNTDIAGHAGCSPSNISRMKSGKRVPAANGRAVMNLAEGIYRYADYENMLPVLGEICGFEDLGESVIVPAIIAWLYAENEYVPKRSMMPRSRMEQKKTAVAFGERLSQAMKLLELTNSQIAALLNVDSSLMSRYRAGIYFLRKNEMIREKLSVVLYTQALKKERSSGLAALCSLAENELEPDAVEDWLFSPVKDDTANIAEALFKTVSDFTPGTGIPPAALKIPETDEKEEYKGTMGLREAVVRFLRDAAEDPGELWLYSDEPMDWMTEDREYFTLWAALMTNCVRSGVRIKIIHNIDRDGLEMVSAIKGWFPLYISGMIEPYVFRKIRNARFCHTLFINKGKACIRGFFAEGAGENRWYDYITEEDRLDKVRKEYSAMIAGAAPFLKTYPLSEGERFRSFRKSDTGKNITLLMNGLSLATMPEKLFYDILESADADDAQRSSLKKMYESGREELLRMLGRGGINELICLPAVKDKERIPVNLGTELTDAELYYTREQYMEHKRAVRDLVRNERNYHLTLLNENQFRDIQLYTLKDSVVLIRCRQPYTAFVFMNPLLTEAVGQYLKELEKQYNEDRQSVMEKLREK